MSVTSTDDWPSPTMAPLSPLAMTPSNNDIKSSALTMTNSSTTPSTYTATPNNKMDDKKNSSPSASLKMLTTSTKKKKLSAVLGDGSFESIMKQRATKRREKDEKCIAELRCSISNMDLNLTQEIKRRIEAVKKLETDCKKNVEDMERKLYDAMDEKIRAIEFRMKNMEEKVQELNERLEEERNKIPKDIEAKGRELKEMINSFQDEFNAERRDRLGREGSIMKHLQDHAEEMRTTWQGQAQNREQCVDELRSRLYEHENNRAQADQGFETLITRELEALRIDVEKERLERMTEDDEIVEALNRYTENLQNSLSALSMTGV